MSNELKNNKNSFLKNETSLKSNFLNTELGSNMQQMKKNEKVHLNYDKGSKCWLVVISCSLINFILFGIYRSYALLYTALLENYNVNRTQATWPFSLCMTIIHLTGPISGLLNSKFSIRTIYATGCFFSTLGIGLCYFAENVTDISLYIGIFQGFGIGLTYVQSLAIISEYFDKKIGLANGISMAGGTIGPFFISPLLNWSLENYSLKESYLILTIITMFTLPMTIVLKHNVNKRDDSNLKKFKLNNIFKNTSSYTLENLSLGLNKFNSNLNDSLALDDKLMINLKNFKNLIDSDNFVTHHKKNSIKIEFNELKINSIGSNLKSLSCADTIFDIEKEIILSKNNSIKNLRICHNQVSEDEKSFFKKCINKLSMPDFKIEKCEKLKTQLTFQNSSSSNEYYVENQLENILKIITSIYFLLIMCSHLAYFWSVITFQMVIVDFSMDCGLSKNSANDMITAFSLGDLIGRLGSGWIIDKNYFSNKYYFVFCSLMIAVILNTLNNIFSYYALLSITSILGVLAGMIVILINVCMSEFLGKKKASLAFGLSAFFCGLATLARPNLVGYFRDNQGSYNGLFNLLSILCYLASFFWVIELTVTKIKIKRKLNSSGLKIDRN